MGAGREKLIEGIPDFPSDCCDDCGMSCAELKQAILKGKAGPELCTIKTGNVKLLINGKEIDMVPFVKRILENAVRGVISELDGYEPDAFVEIKLLGRPKP